ncbi:MAG TPA: DUF192 domain-containing protein [Alphaproteobacteria bacterium]|nr:DUF192 domain-containing protein [Alphaproteobacteria bacterium]
MRKKTLFGLVTLFILSVLGIFYPQIGYTQITFNKELLIIKSGDGKEQTLTVEIAATPQQRQQGLMFRRAMPVDQGMLFLFETPQVIGMWMRNTYLSLDMLFIDQQGKIVGISKRVIPQSDNLIVSPKLVIAVLEINGGVSDKLNIQVGDQLIHSFFIHANKTTAEK